MSDQAEILKALQANAAALQRVSESGNETRAQLLELAKKMATRPGVGGDFGGADTALADLIVKSAGYEAFDAQNTPSFSISIPAAMLSKNTIINAVGSGQPLVASDRVDARGVVFAPQQRLTIRGLFAQIQTDYNMV